MKRIFHVIVVVLFFVHGVRGQELETLLFELPDVIFERVEEASSGGPVYELKVKQPLDHDDHSKGHFYQKVFLTHRGFDELNVMVTEGYDCRRNRIYELTRLLFANQIEVEHRFFGESMPDSLDYRFLNLKQATADLHKINQLMRKIYNGKWISTGISKGGVTSIFYRYFYPEDVDVAVPYVAPINDEFEEDRIYKFLDNVGSKECRELIRDFQIRMFKSRDEILPWLSFYSIGANLEFNYLTLEEAFEFAVLEYPFSFWQWGHKCENIPSEDVPLQKAVEYLINVSGVDFFSDGSMAHYASHYYQSATEMGYYGYETSEFKDLLKALPVDSNPHAAFVPDKMPFEFDGTLLAKVLDWLRENGNQFIYIYGELDTWSASAVPPSDEVDAVWFFMQGKHHGSARIRNMTADEKSLLISSIEKWLEVEIK